LEHSRKSALAATTSVAAIISKANKASKRSVTANNTTPLRNNKNVENSKRLKINISTNKVTILYYLLMLMLSLYLHYRLLQMR